VDPIVVTVLEATKLLHCCRAVVFKLLADGRLERAQSAGRETLILRDSVVAFLRAPSEAPTARRRRAKRGHNPPPAPKLSNLRF
jgi:hypothetical protein